MVNYPRPSAPCPLLRPLRSVPSAPSPLLRARPCAPGPPADPSPPVPRGARRAGGQGPEPGVEASLRVRGAGGRGGALLRAAAG